MNYREVFNKKISDISTTCDKYLSAAEEYCDSIHVDELTDLSEFKDIYRTIDKHKRTVVGIQINFNIDSLKSIIDNEYKDKLNGVENKRNNIILSMQQKMESKMGEKLNEIRKQNEVVRAKNDALRAEIDAANSRYRRLEVKRQRLLEYGPEILQLCADYGIKVSDININNDMFSIDELELFYDEFYTYISSKSNKINPIRWLRDKVQDNSVTLSLIAIGVFVLAFTPVLDVLSVITLAYIMYIQAIQESLVKRYTIMAGLTFNINPMEIGMIKEIPEDMLEQEVSEDIDFESEPELQDMLIEVNKSIESIDVDDETLKESMSKDIAAFTTDYPNMEKELSEVIENFNTRREEVVANLDEKMESLKLRDNYLKSQVKLLGQEFSKDFVMNTKVKLGFDPDTYIYEEVDLGIQNIIFNSRGVDPDDLDVFIKVMLTNYFCNVRPGYFDVTVFDPNGLGRSMAGFYNADMEQTFRVVTDNLNKVITELQQHTDKVLKMTKGTSIKEYNEEASKVGKTCLNYKLLIILSQPKTVEENEALKSFIEYSANLGVFVWMVSNTSLPNTRVFRRPFEGISRPINIDRYEFPVEVANNLADAFKALKSPALMWNEFRDVIVPEDKIWSFNADERIELDPGFEDGDPSKSRGYSVGNTGDIHSIVVGGTGAGKSVFINNIIANVCHKYSPRDVELTLVDFKGSEFNFYLKNESIGQVHMLPHICDCLCTSDPDYSVSLFHKIRSDADARYKFLMAEGFKNMYEFNKAMRKRGTPERCLKRKLVIVDEFQIIFEKTDGKAQDSLKKDITQIAKVARACGIHLMFCSQSMKGTISDDILSQFTLRFGLRCPMEVSQAVMGTKFSGDIREKNGYLYVSSIDDKKKELQKRYRTPFIPDDQLRSAINMLAERAIAEGYKADKEPTTYDETTIHNIEEVDDLYKNTLSGVSTSNLFILGERMTYSDKGRRSNIILARENNQHIFSVFQNTNDSVMFFKTLMRNIELNGGGMCIFNSQVKDLSYVCGVDKYIDEDNAIFFDDEQTPTTLLGVFEDIAKARKSKDNPESLKPLYIFCLGWDKSVGFGVDTQYKITEKYSLMLQTCGVLNMHFIFICSAQGEIPKSIVIGCSHRIAGKCDEKSSNTLLDSTAAYKTYEQDDGYMFLSSYGTLERLKIYRSKIDRQIKERSLII